MQMQGASLVIGNSALSTEQTLHSAEGYHKPQNLSPLHKPSTRGLVSARAFKRESHVDSMRGFRDGVPQTPFRC